MSDQPDIFRCPQCGAGYKRDPRLGGHRVRCRCGQELLVPVARAGPPADEAADYDVTSPPPHPARPAPRVGSPYVAPRVGSPYVAPRTRKPVEEDETSTGPIRNYVLPAIFLALGILIALSQVSWKPPDPPKPNTIYFGQMLVANLLAVMIMLLGAWFCSHLLEMNLGDLGIAAFKLAAICVFAVSTAIAIKRFDRDAWGVYGISTGFCAAMLIYWSGLGLLFKLEIHEVFLTASAVVLLQVIVAWAVLS